MPSTTKNYPENREIARQLALLGVPVFPCKDGSKVKGNRPDRGPLTRNGFKAATTDLDQIDRWWRKHPHAVPGLPTGKASGWAVLDVDRKNGKDGLAALKAIGFNPKRQRTLIVQTPSGGLHVYYRHRDGLTCAHGHLPDGVEVKADGGFVFAPGAVNAIGRYQTTRGDIADAKLLGLPKWPKALSAKKRPKADGDTPSTPVGWKRLKSAIKALPNDSKFDDREDWMKIGMALHHETGGGAKGLALFDRWSRRHHSYDTGMTETVWDSFRADKGDGITGHHVLRLAKESGWPDPRIVAMFKDLGPEPKKTSTKTGLTFLTPTECADTDPRPYVIKGLLAERDVGCIIGAPGVGKSLLGPALGYAVAQGREAFGKRVSQASVLYVAAEDAHGMRGRITALHSELDDAPNFLLVDGVSDLLNGTIAGQPSPDHAALAEAVKARRPGLIILDTLAMAFPGLEENSADGMGRVVAVARSLTKWGAAVLIVHHDTKEGGGLPRGHSLLNGALDVSIHLTSKDDIVTGKLTKNRNGSQDSTMAFEIEARTIGIDSDGDTVTAAIAIPTTRKPSNRTRLPASQEAALGLLLDLGGGEQPVDEKVWRDTALEGRNVCASDSYESRKTVFNRAKRELVNSKRVAFLDGSFRVCETHDTKFEDLGDE